MTPSLVYNWLISLQSTLYPTRCLLCGAPGSGGLDLCLGCLAELPRIARPCHQCGEPLPEAAPPGARCGPCQRRPPAFDRCIAPLAYAGPVPLLVAGLKFHDRLAGGRLLGELLARHLLVRGGPPPELILPIPLHPRRLRQRGFNQALELALPLGRRLGVPLDRHSCRRNRATQPQTELDLKQRRRNLRNAFALAGPLPARHIALVDDVVTTGSTSNELARLLKRAGAERVEVWAAARAVSRHSP